MHNRKVTFPWLLSSVFLAALLLRMMIAMANQGYANDIALFMAWANHAVSAGFSGFYNTDMFVDYPPGYIYILYILGAVKNALALDSASSTARLLFKLPAILADLAAAYFLYSVASRKVKARYAAFLSVLYLFNPAVILDSSAWGQVDSVFVLALVLSIYFISENKIRPASVLFAIAALIKPQAFIFMPVLLLWFIYRKAWRQIPISALYGLGTFGLLALPFFWKHGGLAALIDLYSGTLSSYPFATLNAFNLYAMFDANWKPVTDTWILFSFHTWGYIFIIAAVALSVLFALVKRDGQESERSYYIAMVLIAIVFMGVTKMHERYMFPIMLLGLLAYVQTMDRRLLWTYFGFSITNFINMLYVLDYSSISTGVPYNGIVIGCSFANLALVLYLLYIGYGLYVRKNVLKPINNKLSSHRKDSPHSKHKLNSKHRLNSRRSLSSKHKPQSKLSLNAEPKDALVLQPAKERFNRRDWIWMGAVTILYTILALYQLGYRVGPETVWQPESAGQSIIIDLGETKELDRVNSFGGVGMGKYKYEFSHDGLHWDEPIEVDSDHTFVFRWNKQLVDLEARYVRLSVIRPGFSMHEMAIYEQGSDQPLPIAALNAEHARSSKRGEVSQLFDEQHLAQYNNTFMNSSYFDEIYHARTAYEHIEQIQAYENTHPPLGKIIIAIGIKLFGLNPFGWRIAGTLFGAAMLPLIYMFARRLFGTSLYAGIAALLFAADFMHFTQTRISTIDVYGVFFIMLMFYFMHKYYSLSFYKVKLRTTLVPLFLAGLTFGIGAASKWIVIYGGIGLAVMLAMTLYERYKEYAAAKRQLRLEHQSSQQHLENELDDQEHMDQKADLKHIVRVFPKYTLLTLAVCIVFYVMIPLGIYAASYIPVLTAMPEGYTLKSLIDYQINMFNYHSKLVSTHSFSSTWWEWPFMKRPVWYYSGSELSAGLKSTIVAMGNPIIWWAGLFAMIATIVVSLKRKDRYMYPIWIAYLSQYVPWMLVPRLTYLYHYFAMVPFIIISIVYIFKLVEEKRPDFKRIRNGYVIAATALFVVFYPALSGLTVPSWYIDYVLRWFPSWLF